MVWISQHHDVIAALSSVGTLLVWLIYLQVFISSYRKQLRATLLITRGPGEGLDAQCFLSNMSAGPVYVQSVIITVETDDEAVICPVTERRDLDEQVAPDPRGRTRQGPVGTGEIRGIGSFRALLQHVLNESRGDVASVQAKAIVIEVVGAYGSQDLPVGARRRFLIRRDEVAVRIVGEGLVTTQVRNRHERKKLITELDRDR